MKEIEVSILIPSFNGGELFIKCLEALYRQETDTPFEVIVIDSGSTDGTAERVKEFPLRFYEIKPGEFNHGETRNNGIGLAKGEFVILLTQDALPRDRHLIEALIKPLINDPLAAGVYARQLPREDAHPLTKRDLNGWLTGGMERHVSSISDREAYDKMRPMEKYFFCNFDDVCSAVRVSVWKKIPYTRTDFAEDLEWSKKVLEAGFKIIYEPAAAVIHSHNRSLGYEYKRTRLCHRRLNEIFGLRTVSTKTQLLRYAVKSTIKDTAYIWSEEPVFLRRIFFILRVPFSSLVKLYAQYSGALDAITGRENNNIRGV
ncbi:MAG: glycosyltransferase family 2 protein [Thermodesulfobacteriota bacterium]